MIKPEQIEEIVLRIVQKFNPSKIIMFGSNATGKALKNSDLDLIVVKPEAIAKDDYTFEVRMSLLGMRIPIDLLVYDEDEFNSQMQDSGSFIRSISNESKLLYEQSN